MRPASSKSSTSTRGSGPDFFGPSINHEEHEHKGGWKKQRKVGKGNYEVNFILLFSSLLSFFPRFAGRFPPRENFFLPSARRFPRSINSFSRRAGRILPMINSFPAGRNSFLPRRNSFLPWINSFPPDGNHIPPSENYPTQAGIYFRQAISDSFSPSMDSLSHLNCLFSFSSLLLRVLRLLRTLAGSCAAKFVSSLKNR